MHGSSPGIILTDKSDALHLRPHVSACASLVARERQRTRAYQADEQAVRVLQQPGQEAWRVWSRLRFPEDKEAIEQLLERLDNKVDLNEPFARIREAIGEAQNGSDVSMANDESLGNRQRAPDFADRTLRLSKRAFPLRCRSPAQIR